MSHCISLTLSDAQVSVLRVIARYIDGDYAAFAHDDSFSFVTTAEALKRRGLINHREGTSRWSVTPLGRAILTLLENPEEATRSLYYAEPKERVRREFYDGDES